MMPTCSCLKFVLGLHSDVIGETEIFNQFMAHFRIPSADSCRNQNLLPYLGKLYMDIAVDSREIRRNYLHGLGELSYGGAARRCLKQADRIIIFGNGQLATSILPWILKDRHQVQVVGRELQKLKKLQKAYPTADVLTYQDLRPELFTLPNTALVIAAPLRTEEFLPLLSGQNTNLQVLDFRPHESLTIMRSSFDYYPLRKITAQIHESQQKRKTLLSELRPKLLDIIQRRQELPIQSNLSWEDNVVFA